MERITLPEFYCPFPPQISPVVEQVHAHTLAWATDFQLLQKESAIRRFDGSRFAWLTARAYPQASLEDLSLINDFLSWLFMLDDQFDDGSIGRQPERMRSVIGSLLASIGLAQTDEYQPLQGPIADALDDLWQRTIPLTTPLWQKRFMRHMLSYFHSYEWETRNRATGTIPDVETYIEKRLDAGAMWQALDYMDLTEHVDLPQEIYASSLVQALLRTTNNAVCWSNDIISLEKEIARGDLNNFVLAIQQVYDCLLQEAVERVNEATTNEIKHFVSLSNLIPMSFPDHIYELQKYVAVMEARIRGNLDWSFETHRYSHVEAVITGNLPSYLEAILPVESAT